MFKEHSDLNSEHGGAFLQFGSFTLHLIPVHGLSLRDSSGTAARGAAASRQPAMQRVAKTSSVETKLHEQ